MLSNGLPLKTTNHAWSMYPNASIPVKSNQVGTIWVNETGQLQYTDLTGIEYNISDPTGLGVSLQNSYNNSNPPIINTTNGAVVFQGGTESTSDEIVTIRNNMNENVLSANGSGQLKLNGDNFILSNANKIELSCQEGDIHFVAGDNDFIIYSGANKALRCANDNTVNLGSEDRRWGEIHVGGKMDIYESVSNFKSSVIFNGFSNKQIDLNLISTDNGLPGFTLPPKFVANPLNQDLNIHTFTDVSGLWKVIGSSYEPANNKYVWKAFDVDYLTTFFNSEQNTYDSVSGEYIIDVASAKTIMYGGNAVYHGEYIQVEFPSIYEVKSYRLGMRNDSGWITYGQYTYPENFKMFTSESGLDGSWVQVDVQNNIQFVLNQYITFDLATSVKSRYWRLAVNKIKGSNDNTILDTGFLSIADFKFIVDGECPSNGCIKLQSKTDVQGELNVNNTGKFGGSVEIQGNITCNVALSRNTFTNNASFTDLSIINSYAPIINTRTNLNNDFTNSTQEGEIKYIGEISKVFHLTSSWSWIAEEEKGDDIYNMAVFKNNTLLPFTEIGTTLKSSNTYPITSSLSTIITLNPQDSILLKVKCATNTKGVLIKDLQFVVVEIASPSVLPSGMQ